LTFLPAIERIGTTLSGMNGMAIIGSMTIHIFHKKYP
jgi:hypothetical protein